MKRNEKEMLNALDSINLANLRARKLCRNGLMSVKRSSAIILRSSCIKSDQWAKKIISYFESSLPLESFQKKLLGTHFVLTRLCSLLDLKLLCASHQHLGFPTRKILATGLFKRHNKTCVFYLAEVLRFVRFLRFLRLTAGLRHCGLSTLFFCKRNFLP